MSDLVTVYKKLREQIAEQFPAEDFGPVSISPVDDNMDTNLLTKLKVEISKENKQMMNELQNSKLLWYNLS